MLFENRLQTENCAWRPVVGSIGACEHALSPHIPYIVFKGTNLMLLWFDGLRKHWAVNHSPSRWTCGGIGVSWLQKHFIPLRKVEPKENIVS
jgi:hypothetical protein